MADWFSIYVNTMREDLSPAAQNRNDYSRNTVDT